MIVPTLLASLLAQQSTLKTNLDKLIIPEAESGTLVGVYVCKTSGEELYNHLGTTRLIPASNQKILSSIYAFDKLGADFQFETKFWREGDNVWIDAPGDLTITAEQLYAIKDQLGVSGRGTVYVKQAYRFEYGPSWELDDRPFRYAPSTTALCVNRAQFIVSLSNGIPTVPEWSGVKVKHIPGSKPAKADFDREKETVTIRGKIDPKATLLATFALADPDRAAARVFGQTFVSTKSTPNRAPDYILKSPTIRDYAKLCLEPSDNLLAESLLLSASGASTYSAATKAMVDHHAKTCNLAAGALRPEDGSGMSRHNLVMPKTLAQLLRHVYSQPYRDDYIRALPAGGEGTLGSRLKGLNVTAKTGSLDSVSCLSGYLWLRNGEPVVFSVMMNHFVTPTSQARKLQDEIVQTIYDSLNELSIDNANATSNANWCAPLETNLPISRSFTLDGDRIY